MRFSLIIISSLMLLLSGCAKSLQGDVYTREEARQTMAFQWATVEAVKPVVIEGDRSGKGSLAGAVIGGVAGHGATTSRTQGLATAVGAVAGAIAGEMAEEKMTRAQGVELMLTLDSGKKIVIVQEVETIDEFKPGDRVKVIEAPDKTRVSK